MKETLTSKLRESYNRTALRGAKLRKAATKRSGVKQRRVNNLAVFHSTLSTTI